MAIDRSILNEAAKLLVRLNSGRATAADHAACDRWRQQSEAHQRAWELAQKLTQQFDSVPTGLTHDLRTGDPVSTARRRTLKALTWLAIAAPTGWLVGRMPWRQWNAGYRTATGEQRDVQFADGTEVTLDTDSAIDVAFEPSARRILLRAGEVMVRPATSAQAMQTALLVQSAEGAVQAHGMQFSVQQQHGRTRVAAFRGSVQVLPAAGPAVTLEQGQCCTFTRDGTALPQTLDEREAMWTRGMIYADNMRLGDLIAELSRYRTGMLRCADDVADLRVSGIYQLKDVDATLALLSRDYRLHVHSLTPYWTEVEARSDADWQSSSEPVLPSRPNTHNT